MLTCAFLMPPNKPSNAQRMKNPRNDVMKGYRHITSAWIYVTKLKISGRLDRKTFKSRIKPAKTLETVSNAAVTDRRDAAWSSEKNVIR